jgi:ATP-binding cassette subfamily F protein uup
MPFADFAQWEAWQKELKPAVETARPATPAQGSPGPSAKKKLSYMEAREYATIEERIAKAEQVLQSKQAELENPGIASDGPRLLTAHAAVEEAQKNLDELIERWAELEEKAGSAPEPRGR